MKNYVHAFLNNDRPHLFWLPAILVAWGVHALVPLHLGSMWLGLVWVSALAFGFLTLLALIGVHVYRAEEASDDLAWLNNKLRWLQPLSVLLGALVLALAADMLINWLRGPSDEQEVVLRRVYCTTGSGISRTRLPQEDGKWCFDTRGRDFVIDLPFLGRHEGYDILHADIPITQMPRPVSLGETLHARWRSYHSIFGVADAYYQITDIQ